MSNIIRNAIRDDDVIRSRMTEGFFLPEVISVNGKTGRVVLRFEDLGGIEVVARLEDVRRLQEALSGKASAEALARLALEVAEKADKTEVYTKTEADNRFLTEHQDISGKADADEVYTKTESDSAYLSDVTVSLR